MSARFRGVVALLGLAWALAACGPGVGGTGNGEGLAHFSASPEPLCSAEFADRLQCPPTSSGPVRPGTDPVYLADGATPVRVAALIEHDSLHLDAPCARLAFSGRWGRTAAFGTRFYGSAVVDGVERPASLALLAGDAGFALVVFDTDGSALFGPQTLQRVGAPATPGAC